MTSLTDFVAAVVVHSSAAAFSQFGVTLEQPVQIQKAPPPAAEHVVARSPRPLAKIADCPLRSAHPAAARA